MPVSATSFHLVLAQPAYRRWLSPDAVELRVLVEGGDAQRLDHIQARIVSTDLDTDQVVQRLLALEPGTRELTFSAPRLHSGGEVIILLEDSRNEETLAEGRWKLRTLDRNAADLFAHFDSREVLTVDGVAEHPVIAEPAAAIEKDQRKQTFTNLAGAGFRAVVVDATDELDAVADAAHEHGLAVIARVGLSADGLAGDVVAWREIDNLWGFALTQSDGDEAKEALGSTYRTLRSRAARQFCVLLLEPGGKTPEGYQDVVAAPYDSAGAMTDGDGDGFIPGRGQTMFSRIHLANNADPSELSTAFFAGLTDAAAGCFLRAPLADLGSPGVSQALSDWRPAVELARLGRPVEWTRADGGAFAEQQLAFWARRHRDHFLLAVRNVGTEERQFRIPAPIPDGRLHQFGSAEPIPVRSGVIEQVLSPGQVAVFSNRPSSEATRSD